MSYVAPLPQVVMGRGADITPKTHTGAHSQIHRHTRSRTSHTDTYKRFEDRDS